MLSDEELDRIADKLAKRMQVGPPVYIDPRFYWQRYPAYPTYPYQVWSGTNSTDIP